MVLVYYYYKLESKKKILTVRKMIPDGLALSCNRFYRIFQIIILFITVVVVYELDIGIPIGT